VVSGLVVGHVRRAARQPLMFPPPAIQQGQQPPPGAQIPQGQPPGGMQAGTPPQQQGGPMGGQPTPLPPPGPPPEVTIDAVMRLLRDDAARHFRIDIETDSTIAGDESQERQDRQDFIGQTVKLIEAAGPIVQAQPVMAPLFGELLLFGVRAYRVGRSLEEVIEETVDKLDALAGQPKPPPQPSPDELIKLQGIQAKTQAEIQKAALDVRATQTDHAAKSQQSERDGALMAAEADRKAQAAAEQHRMDLQRMWLEQQQAERDMALKQLEHEHKLELMRTQHEHAMREASKPKGNAK
jgi:hypothetical protein